MGQDVVRQDIVRVSVYISTYELLEALALALTFIEVLFLKVLQLKVDKTSQETSISVSADSFNTIVLSLYHFLLIKSRVKYE
jgi:hypothetical protein